MLLEKWSIRFDFFKKHKNNILLNPIDFVKKEGNDEDEYLEEEDFDEEDENGEYDEGGYDPDENK